jgi:hypothetical protein
MLTGSSVFFIPRRIGVVSRGNRVLAADLSVHAMDGEFATTAVLEHCSSLICGFLLCVVNPSGSRCAIALDDPLSIGAAIHRSIGVFAHHILALARRRRPFIPLTKRVLAA